MFDTEKYDRLQKCDQKFGKKAYSKLKCASSTHFLRIK